ncbi:MULTISPECIES: hypothetical protein [Paenibacillus]|uniref:hypothetical protein n=1 Tax=Paenibacillus TaxID=44249 RepID=UPI0022B89ADD|nr:hypothetical protein [Paenibacillus caseinilyticus]MCZ8522585.1 hypothetical protein [Paenibacillus caseinilyticus]
MKELLRDFAAAYAAEAERSGERGEEQRSLRHPLLFLIVGDRSAEVLEPLYEGNRRKWSNHEGVLYLYAGQAAPSPRENLVSWKPQAPQESRADKRTLRSEISSRFHSEESKLLELNILVRGLHNRLAELGRLYASLDRLHIAVVTRADDPYSVLVPELTSLLAVTLGERFRSVQADAYVLLQERQDGEHFAYEAALGVAFLRELDACQRRTYRFEADLQVTGDGLKLPVAHQGPLFDTVYMLGDKDERGLFAPTGTAGRMLAETLSQVILLKNRRTSGDPDPRHNDYHHGQFKQNLLPAGAADGHYASAGFARVSRPSGAIALTVLHAVYTRMLQRQRDQAAAPSQRELLELLELDPAAPEADAGTLLGGVPHPVEDMHGLMSAPVPAAELQRMSLRDAERALYGGHAQAFFEANAASKARAALQAVRLDRRLERLLAAKVTDDPRYGPLCTYAWTQPDGRPSLAAVIRDWRVEAERGLAAGHAELEAAYEERVSSLGGGGRVSWLGGLLGGGRGTIKAVSAGLLGRIYGLKLELLRRELTVELLRSYEDRLEAIHLRMAGYVERLQGLEDVLREASRRSISEAGEELGRNIPEYYNQVTAAVEQDLESRRGPGFYMEERGIGSLAKGLEEGDEALLQRLIAFVRRDWFSHALFRQPFEQELLERANVAVPYDHREVLSKEELYRDLYRTLENEAAVRADVYRFTHTHRYEEKYYFGDFDSELIRYALEAESGNRSYKLGCVHEKRASGVAKLNLMGGFRLSDLMYYRSGLRYYDTYTTGGYTFHGTVLPAGQEVPGEGRLPDEKRGGAL